MTLEARARAIADDARPLLTAAQHDRLEQCALRHLREACDQAMQAVEKAGMWPGHGEMVG